MTGSNLRNRKKKDGDGPPLAPSCVEEKVASEHHRPTSSSSSSSQADETSFRLVPLIERPFYARLDVLPFGLLYGLSICTDMYLDRQLKNEDYDDDHTNYDNGMNKLILSVVFGILLLAHLGLVLACQWNVTFQTLVGYHIATSDPPTKWTHCFVESKSTTDETGIVPVERWCESKSGKNNDDVNNDKSDDDDLVLVINFHDRTFRYATTGPDYDTRLWYPKMKPTGVPKPSFRSLRYPMDLPISFFDTWQGHMSMDGVSRAVQIYGPNRMVLKLPTLTDLLMEQLVAPFFLFQVFCVTLWSLDEYWYYAFWTLAALLMFESTMAYQRLQSLQRLHEAGNRNIHQRVYVRRGTNINHSSSYGGNNTNNASSSSSSSSSWMLVKTHELVPGDYVSIAAAGQPVPVPADILLVQGTAVCDEALLTGESIPQLKHPLEMNPDASAMLDCQDSMQKESVLFGGTNALVTNPQDDDTNLAPDQGVTGIVLRTGFATTQGNLLRTMAHAPKVDGVHTWDTLVFILLLVAFAIGAAVYVLHEGWQDDRRNRFRLILHVILIVTSVVPPELPMELSLAVTNSFAALVRRAQVYCTELYRIPWAGQVDICCFDKTGTLTSDEVRTKVMVCSMICAPDDHKSFLD